MINKGLIFLSLLLVLVLGYNLYIIKSINLVKKRIDYRFSQEADRVKSLEDLLELAEKVTPSYSYTNEFKEVLNDEKFMDPIHLRLAHRFNQLENINDSLNVRISSYAYAGCGIDKFAIEMDLVDSLLYFGNTDKKFSRFEKYEVLINDVPTEYKRGRITIPYSDTLNIEFCKIGLSMQHKKIDTVRIKRFVDVKSLL